MSESEKKGSAWPWIAVPLCAIVLFFVLRECQHRLPPAEHAPGAAVTVPATRDTPATDPTPADAGTDATPAPEPATEPAPAPQ
jgi:hypothetical protein